jgi:uncharacterized protein (DUF486 family)
MALARYTYLGNLNDRLYMREPLRLDYLWAALCLPGAGYFIFQGG